ncbi:hypothetical protein J3459_010770 [Metarhizium acridum]|nr:hypothetical protein J3459_010770 [Metarhizium acridum]
MTYSDNLDSPSEPPGYTAKSDFNHGDTMEDESLLRIMSQRDSRPKSRRWCPNLDMKHWLAINLAFTSFNLAVVLVLAVLWRSERLTLRPASSSTVSLLPPSPATVAIEKELRPFSLTSPYDKPPGPETDQLWHDLVNTGAMFPLSEEQFSEVNDNIETGIRYTHDPQGRFLGTLAATHQIHCVDALRKGLWFHYEHYRATNDPLFIDKDPPEEHLMHCVEMLRNAVMCFGDVSVITYNWKKGHDAPKGSFKSLHACQKWDKIEDWRAIHNITEEIKTLERPIGIFDEDTAKHARASNVDAMAERG